MEKHRHPEVVQWIKNSKKNRLVEIVLTEHNLSGKENQGSRVKSESKTVHLAMQDSLPPEIFGSMPLGPAGARTYGNGGLGVRFGLTGSVVTEPAYTALPISEGTFWWGVAASTFFWVDRAEDVSVVFMTQLLLSGTYPLRAQLFTLVNAALTE